MADGRRPQQPRQPASASPTPSSTPSPSPVASPTAAASRGSDSPSPAALSPAVLSPAESPQRVHSPVSRNYAAAWGPRGTAAATLARLLLEGGAGAAEEDWDEGGVPPMPQRPAPLLPPLPPQRAPPRAPLMADVSLPHGVVRDVDLGMVFGFVASGASFLRLFLFYLLHCASDMTCTFTHRAEQRKACLEEAHNGANWAPRHTAASLKQAQHSSLQRW